MNYISCESQIGQGTLLLTHISFAEGYNPQDLPL